jgi:hypothetical protein
MIACSSSSSSRRRRRRRIEKEGKSTKGQQTQRNATTAAKVIDTATGSLSLHAIWQRWEG